VHGFGIKKEPEMNYKYADKVYGNKGLYGLGQNNLTIPQEPGQWMAAAAGTLIAGALLGVGVAVGTRMFPIKTTKK